ncbi:RHS repeat-associated protein [Luteibacter sp. OK325]|uniref:RHS repeat-associated core domain-containing protein n=1 Tax=Luteibacter sp. OK325 TaxID=2135670 RepID=UPI000D3CFF2B|nr:RHS repeat-associated core domain-containing protein [Luteibacter sp. OK325]PTR32893.1 RHS repeat-associated protein [Luteibacter sp. OK325]
MRRSIKWLCVLDLLYCSVAQARIVTYVYTDPSSGTPLAEADPQGNTTVRFDYAPYGVSAMGSAPNGPGYTGHVNDPDTGLVYMQARYYEPSAGRFLSVDAKGPTGGDVFKFSRYAYANNNPAGNIDPDGRDILVIAGGRREGSINFFGHIATSVEGYGIASYGTDTALGSSTTQYIESQSAVRAQVVTVITTTASQDAKAINFITTSESKNTVELIDNCAVKTNLIVNAAGVNTSGIPFPGGTSRDIASQPGTKSYLIPQNSQIPQELRAILPNFDPKSQPPPPPPPPPDPNSQLGDASNG